MIDGRKVVGVVAARGGSKRLPSKNLRLLAGRPLIAWTIAAAKDPRRLDRLVVSTDDPRIAAEAERLGAEVPFRRPAALAEDSASSVDVLIHALDHLGETFSLAVLLQPTSPLRRAADIDAAIEVCVASGATACLSVRPVGEPLAWLRIRDGRGRLSPLFGDGYPAGPAPEGAVIPNGAVYVVDVASFRRARTFYPPDAVSVVMPEERSVDIDDEADLIVAEALLRRRAAVDDERRETAR